MYVQSEVCHFYEGRGVFITGATGFLGKVLVEKLLRSCPTVNSIYLLLRPRKEQSAQERLDELFQGTAFERLRVEQPDARNKLVTLSGNITEPSLGLAEIEYNLLVANVSVVFHCAANVRFHATLKSSVEDNVLGTQRVIELCRNLPLLKAFVYVSTAYSNSHIKDVEEKVYPSPVSPQHIIDAIKWMDEDLQRIVQDKLIGKRPNVYTLTKALAEALVDETANDLPVSIVRPSIILSAVKDPYPGWIDNFSGPTALFIPMAKGFARTFLANPKMVVDLCPVDFVANLMITVAWHMGKHRPKNVVLYNCTSGTVNPITIGQAVRTYFAHVLQNPSQELFRYPTESLTSSWVVYLFTIVFQHYLPALALDFISYCTRNTPRTVKLYRKLHEGSRGMAFFTNNEWTFHCHNVIDLYKQLTPKDKLVFQFDFREVNWESYVKDYVLGIRRYVLNEDISTIHAAKANLKRLYYKTQVTKAVILLGILALLAYIIYLYAF